MIFRSPVMKPLHESAWKRPAGNTDFRVTQEFGCTGVPDEPPLGGCAHFHRGIDIGNGGCGSAVVASAPGEVQYAGSLANGELCVILDHGDGWGSGYHHLRAAVVTKGQRVTTGQKIGEVGDTGFANGCHLHWAVKSGLAAGWTRWDFIPNKFGGRGDSTGKWLDPWPLLEQNQPEDDMYPFSRYLPGYSATVGANFRVRDKPTTASTTLRLLQDPETWTVTGFVKGEAISGSVEWLERWANGRYEYVHASGVSGLTPPAGDCTAAVKAATDLLQGQVVTLEAKVTTAEAAGFEQAKQAAQAAIAALTQ